MEIVHKLNAVIVKSGRVISIGENKITQNYYHGIAKFSKELWNINRCAEKHAILKALKTFDGLKNLSGSTIFVTRFDKAGNTKLAKPCKHCEELIRSVGIKKIVFTNDQLSTTTIKIK